MHARRGLDPLDLVPWKFRCLRQLYREIGYFLGVNARAAIAGAHELGNLLESLAGLLSQLQVFAQGRLNERRATRMARRPRVKAWM